MKVNNAVDKLRKLLIDCYKSSTFNRNHKTADAIRLYETLLASEIQLQNGEVVPLDDALIDKVVADAL